MRVKSLHPVILIVGLVVVLMQPVLAQERMMTPESGNQDEFDPNVLPEDAWKPGQVEGTGTYFEITDSEYLNIAVESSEVVYLRLESIPEMIVMNIASANDSTSAQLILSGFEPSWTYYKYEDDYHNGSAIEMDSEGMYVYEQDLSKPHLIFIQSRPSTKFIPTDTTIGVWDSSTRTYTLTMDVNETIQIDANDLTVDGAWHTVTGYNTGQGIYLGGRTGVTIKNLQISNFSNGILMNDCQGNVLAENILSENSYGIYMDNSEENELVGNTATGNLYGIYLYKANGNKIEANVVESSAYQGIYLQSFCKENIVADNTARWNGFAGIDLGYRCDYNEVKCNSSSENDSGVTLYRCAYNILTDNTAVSNDSYGIILSYTCSRNNLLRNAISGNDLGLYLGRYCNNNKIYNNNFIDNTTQATVSAGTLNEYCLPAPVGGNFWNDWTEPDENVDGFVDFVYIFDSGGRDVLPLTAEVALLCNQPPVAQGGDDQVVVVGDTVVLDGSGSYDANLDDLDYSWGFDSWPEGSKTELLEPTSVVTSFIPDVEGEYVISLIVNDGLADSEPDDVTIEVVAVHDAVDMALADISGFVRDIDDDSLRNRKLRKPLTNKVDAVMQMVDEGCYEDALKKLEHDILGKTNGCVEISEADKNDWITDCDEQEQLYDLLIRAIELLERLV
jgi:parallel beta-helix repeat protein